ncbi:MAG: phosphohistidine phosphatase SixA [Acidimicrobiia bacterium]|nr:phosphohistidine phosphatase SixA [Acidimicrobiia bacterium]
MTGCELYLVRHAIAADRGPDWPNDARRPLTAHGITRFQRAADGLVAIGDVSLDAIFTSPLVRAVQTADLLAAAFEAPPPVSVLQALEPGHGPAAVLDALTREPRRRRLALVGHEPDLGELVSHLLGARSPVPFKKGGICRIDVHSLPPSRAGTLVWFLPPRVLRRLDR